MLGEGLHLISSYSQLVSSLIETSDLPRKLNYGVDYDDDYDEYDYGYEVEDNAETPPEQETIKRSVWHCAVCTYDDETMSSCDICGVLRGPLLKNLTYDEKNVLRSFFFFSVSLYLRAWSSLDCGWGVSSKRLDSSNVSTATDKHNRLDEITFLKNLEVDAPAGSRTSDNSSASVPESCLDHEDESSVAVNMQSSGKSLLSLMPKERNVMVANSSSSRNGGKAHDLASNLKNISFSAESGHSNDTNPGRANSYAQYKPEKWMLPGKEEHSLAQLNLAIDTDFVPNMITGATQADAAILVIDASIGSFEAGIDGTKGQTREHAQLIRSCGFKDSSVSWIPLSAAENQNLVSAPSDFRLSWYHGPNLLDTIDSFQPPTRDFSKRLLMAICDVIESSSQGQVLVMPSAIIPTVHSLDRDSLPCTIVRAGDNVAVNLHGVDANHVLAGGVLCHPGFPVAFAKHLEWKLEFHIHHVKESARVARISSLLDSKTGKVAKKAPRCIVAKKSAVEASQLGDIVVILHEAVCVEEFSKCKALGRVFLMTLGRTVAVGIVTRIVEEQLPQRIRAVHIYWNLVAQLVRASSCENSSWENLQQSSELIDTVPCGVIILIQAEKLEQAENRSIHSRIGPLALGTSRKKEESRLAKITRDCSKITVEQVHSLMSQSNRPGYVAEPMIEA
ncbi:Translation elongation factor EF1A/initiation factor IF2gamma family protein isoform 4 [Hibiscus syriacus]|uniref:Translation elongation factor EF1A/initiation factor IF2gamma family protein isoform 4 n=1 Tax=Hibiscus syriacus TaxID=106335 RepID=A0A6A3D0U5_HIBSY|nr:Translation elongation factor EF1A/initiation factor IF2gamma family protein isoform 4 [Hibiscus syriacus]